MQCPSNFLLCWNATKMCNVKNWINIKFQQGVSVIWNIDLANYSLNGIKISFRLIAVEIYSQLHKVQQTYILHLLIFNYLSKACRLPLLNAGQTNLNCDCTGQGEKPQYQGENSTGISENISVVLQNSCMLYTRKKWVYYVELFFKKSVDNETIWLIFI